MYRARSRHDHERALQDPHEQEFAPRVVAADPRSELGELRLDLLARDEDAIDIGFVGLHVTRQCRERRLIGDHHDFPFPGRGGAGSPTPGEGRAESNILLVAPRLQSRAQIPSPSGPAGRQIQDRQHVRSGARNAASVDRVGRHAAGDRPGKIQQPGRQEVDALGRLVDHVVEHLERLSHQLVGILTEAGGGPHQRFAEVPADGALEPGKSAAPDRVAQEPSVGVRRIGSRPQVQ